MLKKVLLLFFSCIFSLQAQKFKGIVKNTTTKKNIEEAVVIAKTKKAGYKFAFTNNKGEFLISIPKPAQKDTIFIEIKRLGFQTLKTKKTVANFNNSTFFLQEKKEKLNEIIIESKRKIKVNKDTITYRISNFINQTEATVEDVLKKLPGIEVNEEGTIKIGGKEIQKILIEGDDLTAENYKILSKNLQANVLKSVQILRNYDDNPIKKQIQKSEKIALNILIKESKKNILFGSIKTGLGTKEKYNFNATIGRLNKKFKILSITNLNNVGKTLLLKNTIVDDDFDIDKNFHPSFTEEAQKITGFQNSYLKKEETLLNNSKGTSLTFNKKNKKGLTTRFLGDFNNEKVDFLNSKNISFTEQQILPIQEIAYSLENNTNYSGNIELKYLKNNTYITLEGKLNKQRQKLNEHFKFNNENNTNLLNENTFLNNFHLKTTSKITDNSLLRNYFYYQKSNRKEDYTTQKGIYNTLNNLPLQQNNKKEENIIAWKGEYLKQGIHNGFSFNTSFNSSKHLFSNKITTYNTLLEEYFASTNSVFFGTKMNYFYLKNQQKKIVVSGQSVFNSLNGKSFNLYGYNFLYNLNAKRIGSFSFSYDFNQKLLNAENFYKNTVLKNYRTINHYNNDIQTVNNNTFRLLHNFQQFHKGFLTFTVASYTVFNKSVLVNSNFTNGYVENQYNFIKNNSSLLFLQNQTSKYFSSLNMSLKLDNSFTKLTSFYKLNNLLAENTNYGYTTKLSGTTYFKRKINFQFFIQYDIFKNKFNNETTTTNNIISTIVATYKLNDEIIISSDVNNYYFNNKNYNLIHGKITYKPKKSRFNYGLILHNIFNTKELKNVINNDFSVTKNSTAIIPNYYMITINFRI